MELDWSLLLLLFFVLLAVVLASGMPVAFGFLTLNILGLYFFMGGEVALSLLATSAFSSVGQFALIPIPLFILMGELLMRTGLANMTVDAADVWIGRLPGRLAVSAVGGGTLFGALSGASMASVAMLGSTLVPEMGKREYRSEFSVGAILAGGGLAVLIPPSALGVLLGALAKVSIAKLLLAGLLPGLVLAALYFAYFTLRAKLQPHLAPPYVAPPMTLAEKLYSLLRVAPLFSLIVVVTGFIFMGIATPSEAAAMGVVATIAIAACYRRLTWEAVKAALMSTTIDDVDDAAGDRGIGGVFADPRRHRIDLLAGRRGGRARPVARGDGDHHAAHGADTRLLHRHDLDHDGLDPGVHAAGAGARARSDLVLHPDPRAARARRDHAALRRAAVRDEGRSAQA